MGEFIKREPIPVNAAIGIVIGFVYMSRIINLVHFLAFKNENIAALKFTFTNLLFIPISFYLGFLTFVLITFIYQKIRYGVINKPETSLLIKHICLFIAVLIATIAVMQCRTIVYADGSIKSYNYIEKYSPEYTIEDYKKAIFYGEVAGSSSPNRPQNIRFQFYFTFILDDDTYIEFYPEEFRDLKAIKSLGNTLGDKFSVLPEGGFPPEYALHMSEDEVNLWNMMFQ